MKGSSLLVGLILLAACSGGFEVQRSGLEGETPPATADAVAAWDPLRERLVLFGGSESGQTWLYDGAAWTMAATEGPGVRSGASMTWDPGRRAMVLFGGFRPTTPEAPVDYLADTWLWDGAAWRPLTDVGERGPAPRAGAVMTWDAALRGSILYGGSDVDERFRDLWVLTASAGWAEVPSR